MSMKESQIRKQSEVAYKQWAKQWRQHCVQHSQVPKKSLEDFRDTGLGKAILCVANGYSLEENIDVIKQHKDNVDIICCDKALGHLLDNGITPTFVVVCDANVNYDKYLKPWKDKLGETTLFINACGNPEWTFGANWKDIYMFVNKDIIESEKEFSLLSGCQNVIIAGTNVSNAMLILLTQCENKKQENFFGYDKYVLIGYDYSWKHGGKYYAFSEDGGGKDLYMRHLHMYAEDGTPLYTSGNLWFSKNWLDNYIKTFSLPVIQTAKHSVLQFGSTKDLAHQLKYSGAKDSAKVYKLLKSERARGIEVLKKIDFTINDIQRKQRLNFLQSI